MLTQKPVFDEIFGSQGIRLLYTVPFPGQGLFTKEPVANVDDLKGMKIRVAAPIVTNLVQELGAEPTVTEAPEIAQAFLTGMVDAMITGSPVVGLKPWEFSKYFYTADAYESKSALIVNKAAFDALPESVQKVILEVAAEAEQRGWAGMVEDDQKNIKLMTDNGMIVEPPSPELMTGLRAAGAEVLAKWRTSAGDEANAVIDTFEVAKKQ